MNNVDNNRVNLLLCANQSYVQHVAVCLRSVLENSKNVSFNIVIVGRQGEVLDQEKLKRSLPNESEYTLAFRSFSPPMEQILPLNPNTNYTLDIWTRIWVSDFFDENVDKVLYLDSDIVVVGDIKPLWDIDLEGAMLGAVDIPGSIRGVDNLGMQPEDGYFNSGVLLIDLKQWRSIGALGLILNYVTINHERLKDPDQDALNACFYDNCKRLSYKWNVISPFFKDKNALPLSIDEITKVREDAVIIHFNGLDKPWNYICSHPRKEEYWCYLKLTEWKGYIPPDKTPINMFRGMASRVLPSPIKKTLKWVIS